MTMKGVTTGKRTQKQVVGQIGENATAKYLENKGFTIVDRNYRRKWGELDIVAEKGNKLHFVEVKSVSRPIDQAISREREGRDGYRAEDNMHPWKQKRLSRALQTYLLDKDVPSKMDWQFDLAVVLVDQAKRICRVTMMWDIVL